jgi:hypothetical protein
MNIWAVSCLFAFTPSHFRSRNYKIFRENLKNHNVKLLTVEFNPEGIYELTKEDADILIQLSDGDIMWQKERLLNIGIDHLPTDTDIVLILDTDIIFSHEDMIDRIVKKINDYKVVQCYSHTMQLHPLFLMNIDKINFFKIDNTKNYFFHDVNRSSFLKEFLDPMGAHKAGEIGLAWAYRYDVIKKIKLFDHNIIGAGDNATMCAFIRIFKPFNIIGTGNSWFKYCDLARQYVDLKDVSYLEDTIIYSLYHGEVKDKNYVHRHEIIEKHNFDSTKQLIIKEGLPFKFDETVGDELKQEIKDYFINRKEDDPLPF